MTASVARRLAPEIARVGRKPAGVRLASVPQGIAGSKADDAKEETPHGGANRDE